MLAPLAVTIDDTQFEIGALALKDARAVLVCLTRTLGPALTKFAGKDVGGVDSTAALAALMVAVTAEDLEFVCDKFGAVCKVQLEGGKMVPVKAAEVVFQGRLMVMFKWIWACIDHNYGDLFLGLTALTPPAPPAAPIA